MIADTTCNPDQAITQARRLVHQEKVHFMIGPLCGHEGPAVAQVSKETGVPLVMDTAGADNVTKWDRTPTVIRTAVSASQIGHPFGDYLYKELGARNVTFIAQDYTWGHEVALGMVQTFKDAGGKVAKIIWNPIGTKDYGPTVASIDPGSDAVVAVVVGADRIRLFEVVVQLRHGQEVQDLRRLLDAPGRAAADGRPRHRHDRQLAALCRRSRHAGKQGVHRRVRQEIQAAAVLVRRVGLHGGPVDAHGDRADRRQGRGPRGVPQGHAQRRPSRRRADKLKLDDYDNPIQNVYVSRIQKINHPVLGEVLTNVPIKTYEAVSQFWTWTPEEFLEARSLQAVSRART